MVVGLIAGASLALTRFDVGPTRLWFLVGAACVQLRLLANMLDGMVAIESGQASAVGELYNEVPDRVADAVILIGLGYATGGSVVLGYLAGLVAMFIAYVRAAVKVAGGPSDFCGPMAKPQRMFLVTLAAVFCAAAPAAWLPALEGGEGIPAGCLAVILVGGLCTAIRRLVRGSRALRS